MIQAAAVAHDVAQLAETAGRPIAAGDVETLTWALYERGRAISAAELLAGRELASAWSRRVASWWDDDGFDLLLSATAADAASRLTIRGAGFGHGVGMSQYGAMGYAEQGAGYRDILAHYYTGTGLGTVETTRVVRVLLQSTSGAAAITGAERAGTR